jgi:hypothetical protein
MGLILCRQFSVVFLASLPAHCILITLQCRVLRATSGQYRDISPLFIVLCNACMSHSFSHTWCVTTEIVSDVVRVLLHVLYLTARAVHCYTYRTSLHVPFLAARAVPCCTYRTLLHVLFLAARAVPYYTYCNLLSCSYGFIGTSVNVIPYSRIRKILFSLRCFSRKSQVVISCMFRLLMPDFVKGGQ